MKKYLVAAGAIGLALACVQPRNATAAVVTVVYVNATTGNESNVASNCAITTPCATINTAIGLLSTTNGGSVYIIGPGIFGPVYIPAMSDHTSVNIISEPNSNVVIQAGAGNTGCPGTLWSAGGCATNNGFALEVNTGGSTSTSVRMKSITLSAGSSGTGALQVDSVGTISLSDMPLRGNGSITGPIVNLAPTVGSNNAIYIKNADVGFSNGGGILVQPKSGASASVAFINVAIHNVAYGIKGDATLAGAGNGTSLSLEGSSFFSMSGAGVTLLSTSGGGTSNAILNNVNIFRAAAAALNNNGPNSYAILTNSTFVGNGKGISNAGGGIVSSGNNTIYANASQNSLSGQGGIVSPLQ